MYIFNHLSTHVGVISNCFFPQCTTQKRPSKVLSFHFETLCPSAKSRLLSPTIAYLLKLIPFCCCLFEYSQILLLRSVNCTSLFKLINQYLWVQKKPSNVESATVSRSVRTQSKRESRDSDVILKHWNISAAKLSVNSNHPLNHYDPSYSSSVHMAENSIIWMLGIKILPFLSSHLRKWVYQYVTNYFCQ